MHIYDEHWGVDRSIKHQASSSSLFFGASRSSAETNPSANKQAHKRRITGGVGGYAFYMLWAGLGRPMAHDSRWLRAACSRVGFGGPIFEPPGRSLLEHCPPQPTNQIIAPHMLLTVVTSNERTNERASGQLGPAEPAASCCLTSASPPNFWSPITPAEPPSTGRRPSIRGPLGRHDT